MRSRTGIILLLAAVAGAFATAWVTLRDPQPTTPSSIRLEQTARSDDRVGELVPFEPRRERPVAPGQFRVWGQDGLFSVVANQAWRLDILEEVADRGDFRLDDHVRKHPFVSLDVRGESIERVLAQVVRDTPYSISYTFENDASELSIESLEVGVEREITGTEPDEIDESEMDSGERLARKTKTSDVEKRRNRERKRPGPRPEAERRIAMQLREQREAERHAEYVEDLDAPEPETRAWAVSALDVEDPKDLVLLAGLLGTDPDPAVRVEIAYDLGFGDPQTAVPLLVSALDDPAPEVVVAAAHSLGFLDDASAIPELEALWQDESETVQEAARNALKMLEGAK